MTNFTFRAFSSNGGIVQGVVDAPSEADALGLLHGKGMTPYFARESAASATKGNLWRRRLGLADRAALAGQIATLLDAELPIDRSLRIVEGQAPSRAARRIVTEAIAAIVGGGAPSSALSADGNGFAIDETALIKAGEQSGSLAGVFSELAAMLAARAALRDKIASALVYPLILLAMTGIAIFIVATVLVPNIEPLFEQSGVELPILIRALNAVGGMLNEHGLAAPVILLGLSAFGWAAFRLPGPRRRLDRAILRAPIIGPFARHAESARFCRTLGVLLKSGARLQPALAAARDVARNVATRDAVDAAIENLVGGQRLAPALAGVEALDTASRQMIAIGEEVNRLDQMLLKAAALNEVELGKRIERFMTLLTPIVTILLGALVGSLIISVMNAILSVNELALS
jgi:general secretion pathway protein F